MKTNTELTVHAYTIIFIVECNLTSVHTEERNTRCSGSSARVLVCAIGVSLGVCSLVPHI